MPVINPYDCRAPVPQIHDAVMAYVADVSGRLGAPAFEVKPVRMRDELVWSCVWFIDGKNNNISVTRLTNAAIMVEIHSDRDPTMVKFHVQTPELLAECLARFTPDHWRETA